MTNAEIITSVLSVLALLVSGMTAYLTLISRFHASVLPRHRPILTQIDGTSCLVLDCEFVNEGAKSGSIEDLLLEMFDEQGNRVVFSPFLVKDQFNVFQLYQITDFAIFSGIALGAKQRDEVFIVFRPTQANFNPQAGVMTFRTNICTNIQKGKWSKSTVRISVDVSKENVQEWLSKTGKPQQVTAIEVGKNRRSFLDKQQR